MKGIFCHDLPIYRDIDGVYCSTTLTNHVFERYLHVVDQLVVAIRIYPLDKTYSEACQEKIDLPGLEFLEIPNLNSLRGLLQNKARAKHLLEDEIRKSDLIFIRGGTIAVLATNIAIKHNKKYLLEVGGCAWDTYWNHSLVGKLIAPYMEYHTKKSAHYASHTIYVTEKWLQKRYPSQGSSIGICDAYLPDPSDEIIFHREEKIRLRQNDVPLIIGTTAKVDVRYKGQEYIIKAIAHLKKCGYIFRYELVGGGDKAYLTSLAKKYDVLDQVIFKGELVHDEVIHWLDQIDIYAQPSKAEGLPRALIEAMSRGCPAIGSTTGGIPELLTDDVIFGNGNIRQIYKILVKMSNNDLYKYAKRNFEKSKTFNTSVLNAQRSEFIERYASEIRKEKLV